MKKIITVLTSVAMLLMGTTANLVAKAEEYYRLGDVNMDGEVDAVDASAILTYYARISVGENDSNINEALADFDRNGRIDSVDASMVLSLYAKSATMQSVSYELVSIDVNDDSKIIPSKSDRVEFGSVLRFNRKSWALHSRYTENLDADLYEKHQYIHNGDTVVVVGVLGDGWFKISFPENVRKPEQIYIYISDVAFANGVFEKVGENKFLAEYTENLTTTSVAPITTTTTTTTTTETTTTTTTAHVVVLQETLPVIPVAMDPIPSVHDKKMYKFHGESWYIHSKITMDPKGDLYPEKSLLLYGESFYVVNSYAGGWYEIYCSSINDTANVFICMSEEDFESFCEYINFKRFE